MNIINLHGYRELVRGECAECVEWNHWVQYAKSKGFMIDAHDGRIGIYKIKS